MNNRAVTLSLIMAGFAVFFVSSYVNKIEDAARKRFGAEVWVLKAREDIHEQESLTEAMITIEKVPRKFLEPSSIYIDPKDASDAGEADALKKESDRKIKSLLGTVAVVPIRKGEQIGLNKISEPGIRTGLSPQISPGKRAIAVPVNEVTGVAKLVKPGDRVDVIAVLDTGAGKQNRIVKTVLQDVVVLAVGHNVTGNAARLVERDPVSGRERVKPLTQDSSFTSVTLEVEPVQAQAMALLIANGDNAINLSLRNNDDSERTAPSALMINDVLGPDRARLPAQERPR
jgi:pilus assembly protein CpaB